MTDDVRCKLFIDESRVWNMDMADKNRKSFMVGYIYEKLHVVNMLNITGTSKNLAIMTPHDKNIYLRRYSEYFHRTSSKPDVFYSCFNKTHVVIWHASDTIVVYYNKKK